VDRDELVESLDEELGDILDEDTLDESLNSLPEFDETGVGGRFSDLINGLNMFSPHVKKKRDSSKNIFNFAFFDFGLFCCCLLVIFCTDIFFLKIKKINSMTL